MMGVWFLATAGSEYIASLLANIASVPNVGGEIDLEVSKTAYATLFEKLFYIGLISGAFLLIISPIIKKMMHGIDDDSEGIDASTHEIETPIN